MEITKELIVAVERGVNALRNRAIDAEREPDSQANTSVGEIVRIAIEEHRQSADVLDGWAFRARKKIGWPRDSQGFTLIELMIVVAIIGILAAIAIPEWDCKVNGNKKSCSGGRHMDGSLSCVAGYKFVNYGKTQLLDNQGHGIPCSDDHAPSYNR